MAKDTEARIAELEAELTRLKSPMEGAEPKAPLEVRAAVRRWCSDFDFEHPATGELIIRCLDDLDHANAQARSAAMPDGNLVLPLEICAWNGDPAHCVYLNDHRIAGGKPWGGGTTSRSFSVRLQDVLDAIGVRAIRARRKGETNVG